MERSGADNARWLNPYPGGHFPRVTRLQAYRFFLGMMAAYAPCLIFLALMLRDIGTYEPEPLRVKTSDAPLHASRQAGSIH